MTDATQWWGSENVHTHVRPDTSAVMPGQMDMGTHLTPHTHTNVKTEKGLYKCGWHRIGYIRHWSVASHAENRLFLVLMDVKWTTKVIDSLWFGASLRKALTCWLAVSHSVWTSKCQQQEYIKCSIIIKVKQKSQIHLCNCESRCSSYSLYWLTECT